MNCADPWEAQPAGDVQQCQRVKAVGHECADVARVICMLEGPDPRQATTRHRCCRCKKAVLCSKLRSAATISSLSEDRSTAAHAFSWHPDQGERHCPLIRHRKASLPLHTFLCGRAWQLRALNRPPDASTPFRHQVRAVPYPILFPFGRIPAPEEWLMQVSASFQKFVLDWEPSALLDSGNRLFSCSYSYY